MEAEQLTSNQKIKGSVPDLSTNVDVSLGKTLDPTMDLVVGVVSLRGSVGPSRKAEKHYKRLYKV